MDPSREYRAKFNVQNSVAVSAKGANGTMGRPNDSCPRVRYE